MQTWNNREDVLPGPVLKVAEDVVRKLESEEALPLLWTRASFSLACVVGCAELCPSVLQVQSVVEGWEETGEYLVAALVQVDGGGGGAG
jgi:hypothetical protein